MPVILYKSEAVCKLENLISEGKKTVIFDHNDLDVLHRIHERLKQKDISDVEVWQYIEESPDSGYSTYVTRREIDEILEFYRMYDFSDKVFVVSDSDQYGSLFNYVKTGILTKQEMVDALLYKI